jgi:hypothetical protein
MDPTEESNNAALESNQSDNNVPNLSTQAITNTSLHLDDVLSPISVGSLLSPHYGTIKLTNTYPNSNVWTQSGTTGTNTYPNSNVWTQSGTGTNWGTLNSDSGKITLLGDKADIVINGKSLSSWMSKVEERLNILQPNVELEKEWDDLRRVGEQYRKLEELCKQKSSMWQKLKSIPPTESP